METGDSPAFALDPSGDTPPPQLPEVASGRRPPVTSAASKRARKRRQARRLHALARKAGFLRTTSRTAGQDILAPVLEVADVRRMLRFLNGVGVADLSSREDEERSLLAPASTRFTKEALAVIHPWAELWLRHLVRGATAETMARRHTTLQPAALVAAHSTPLRAARFELFRPPAPAP